MRKGDREKERKEKEGREKKEEKNGGAESGRRRTRSNIVFDSQTKGEG